jgi:hypothetical protein
MPYALHAVVIDKSVPIDKAKKMAEDIIRNKSRNFYRIDNLSYRFRNLPKTYFNKDTFRSKVVNDKITLVFGELLPKYSDLK